MDWIARAPGCCGIWFGDGGYLSQKIPIQAGLIVDVIESPQILVCNFFRDGFSTPIPPALSWGEHSVAGTAEVRAFIVELRACQQAW
jgi:hypothetical protein